MNFTVWNKKNCKIHTIRTRKLFLKDGNRSLLSNKKGQFDL